MSFDLRAVVRDVLTSTPIADPDQLVPVVLDRVPADQHVEALRQALRPLVVQVAGQIRMQNPIAPSAQMPSTPAMAKANRSWKVTAIRDGWQKTLRNRINVADGEWKFLADCTRDDLLHAASERQTLADRNAAIARSYRALAGLLPEHDAETVGELPAEVLMAALGRVA